MDTKQPAPARDLPESRLRLEIPTPARHPDYRADCGLCASGTTHPGTAHVLMGVPMG